MRSLFESWGEVKARLAGATRIALFLDFDGTLTKIRPRPEEVKLDSETRRTLAGLASSRRFRVSVISGRRQADLRARIGVQGIHYLGLHGWDRGDDGELSDESRALLECVKSKIALTKYPGVWMEDKRQILAVHYREATEETGRGVREALNRAIRGLSRGLKLVGGKMVWEIVPRELEDKGTAVRRELAALCCDATAVYAGDDLGDEPAFAALRHGITVYVGRARMTKARFHLADEGQVRLFLRRMREEFA
ncbi:MAG TPA: trehalose-phosphatase [Bryobacteraceae bacterium]|nr:trehalose-phosphatase [Bryobacteraceae bacterium]